jgi:flagellar hook-associated protein 3 FlgL
MINQIGTNAFYNKLVSNLQSTSSDLNQAQTQGSTGQQFQTYDRYGSNIKPIVALQNQQESMSQYVRDNNMTINRHDLMSSSMRALVSVMNEFRSSLTMIRSATPLDADAFSTITQNNLDYVQRILNKTDNGEYLFAGSLNVPPVDLSKLPAAMGNLTTPDFSYYQGNDETLKTQIAQDLQFSYGIKANEPGIEKLIRSMKMSLGSAITTSPTLLNATMDLTAEAVNEIADILQRIGYNQKHVLDVNERIKDDKVIVDQSLTELQDADLPTVLTDIARRQTQLTALYMIMTNNQTSLLDYMR